MLFKLRQHPKNQFIVLVILGIIFFFIYSFLIFGNTGNHFTWPDETANYFFIKNYIEHSNFSVAEPLNEIAGNLVKPRSFNVYQGNLVPGSFLGLLLIYGLIGKVIGLGLVKFLTPLLAVLAGLLFYKILLKIFKPKIAFLSALLFFINPAWWYYANFTFLPNIAFLSFLIIGIYFLIELDKGKKQNNYLFLILGSFFVALALIIRTNEFLWILGILLLLLIVYFKKVKWQYILLFLVVCILVFLPIFYYNQMTYDNYLSFGYLRLDQGNDLISQLPTEFQTSHSQFFNFIQFIVLPFGLHPQLFFSNFYNYCLVLFWWLFIPAVLGIFFFLQNYHKKNKAVFFLIFLAVSFYLIVYYGSWQFADQLTAQLNKIGISYVRYWLPIYILSLPLISIFYLHLIQWLKNKKIKILLNLLFISTLIYFTINLTYLAGNDNLIKIKQNIQAYNEINQKVTNLTEDNAVIISQRSDKIFFPERKVVGRFVYYDDFDYWQNLLDAGVPLYYYAYEGYSYVDDLDYDLFDYGMQLIYVASFTAREDLYKIEFVPYEELDYEEFE